MSTQGQTGKLTFCIAENEAESPWPPLHVERGFAPTDSTVTVIGASAGHNIFTYGCETGAEIMEHFIGAMTALGHNNSTLVEYTFCTLGMPAAQRSPRALRPSRNSALIP